MLLLPGPVVTVPDMINCFVAYTTMIFFGKQMQCLRRLERRLDAWKNALIRAYFCYDWKLIDFDLMCTLFSHFDNKINGLKLVGAFLL